MYTLKITNQYNHFSAVFMDYLPTLSLCNRILTSGY